MKTIIAAALALPVALLATARAEQLPISPQALIVMSAYDPKRT